MKGKILTVVGISLALCIPLILVTAKIQERSSYREVARFELGKIWSNQQRVLGPLLVIPYRVHEEGTYAKPGDRRGTVARWRTLIIAPAEFEATANLRTQRRYRGIYEIPVYDGSFVFAGRFPLQAIDALTLRAEFGEPYLSFAVTDTRGILDTPVITAVSETLTVRPGARLGFHTQGVHAPIDLDLGAEQESTRDPVPFRIEAKLRGMSSLSIAPIGDSSVVRIDADWPHPSFVGPYAPVERTITDEGFEARWTATSLATNLAEQVKTCADQGQCPGLWTNTAQVDMIDPVDIYVQAQRATKYGVLFIGLTFGTFFLFEVFGRSRIHAMQYTLVGAALCLFYLVLLSLAEHIRFALAYTLATLACGGLITAYVRDLFARRLYAAGFACALFGLYAVLFTIIRAEDFALLMGTALLFGVLTLVMWLTRTVDWFALFSEAAERRAPKQASGDSAAEAKV